MEEDEGTENELEEDVFEVEKILNHRTREHKREYLIKWLGFPPEENSWEAEDNLNCPELLAEYEMSYMKSRRRPITHQVSHKPIAIEGVVRRGRKVSYITRYDDGTTGCIKSSSISKENPGIVMHYYESLVIADFVMNTHQSEG